MSIPILLRGGAGDSGSESEGGGGGGGGAGGLSAGSVPRCTLTVEIAWNVANSGVFTFGTSTIGGPDVLGVSPGDPSFTGLYDDVSARVTRAAFDRGRSDDLAEMSAGRGSLTLRDPDGRYNPANPASPLYSVIADRIAPCRITGHYAGSSFPLFYGWARRLAGHPQQRRHTADFELVDLFYFLAARRVTIASTGATTTGAAIGLILDACGWTSPSLRQLDNGDAIPDFAATDEEALALIGRLLEAEGGLFYIDGAGVAVYESRHGRSHDGVAATVASEMRAVSPGLDFDRVRTRATVTRDGGTPQTFEDTAASGRVGVRDATPIETPYLANDAAALALATWRVQRLADPRLPLRALELEARTPELMQAILGREVRDLVTVTEAETGTTGDFRIERRSVEIIARPRRVSATWNLAKAPATRPFKIGVSTIGGTDVLDY